jgi:rsbT co-antagonist protein RsbR
VRLLGAEIVLTGIGATMAQTLVHLGADMSTITTRGTLQDGIAYAMERDQLAQRAAR